MADQILSPVQLISQSPLSLPGWVEFNERKWRLKSERLLLGAEGKPLPAVQAVIYTNRSGKLILPPLNPYLPVGFTGTATDSLPKLYRQWLTTGELLAADLQSRHFAGAIALHYSINDIRPLQWAGFHTSVRYTFHISLPIDYKTADNDVRRRARIAEDSGLTCELATEMNDVYSCLTDTESRQEFKHHLTADDLHLAKQLLGSEHFRTYLCRAKDGTPASTMLVLHAPGCFAIDLAAGTQSDFLPSGAMQLITKHCLDDLHLAGATGFDFAGANLASIAAAKMQWGGVLVPYYTVEQYNLHNMARFARAWWRSSRSK